MSAVVDGTLVPMSALADLTDWAAVKKVGGTICISGPCWVHVMVFQYNKLSGDPIIKEMQSDPTREHRLIDNIVVSFVAMKSVSG
jgi:EKC/KEOPS complex subunit CGI121/TPRKB